MHRDVNVQPIVDSDDDNIPKTSNKSPSRADIDHFFRPAPKVPGEKKGHLQCLSCAYVQFSIYTVVLIYIYKKWR